MTALNLTNLGNFVNMDFATFKALHIQGQNQAELYYETLKTEAQNAGLVNVENYASLALGVVENNTLKGVTANGFTQGYADAENIDFSEGSDARLQMQLELIKADFQARENAIVNNSGTGELNYQQTIGIHSAALNSIGLPPESFTLYTPLSILAKYDPEKAQSLFEREIDGDPNGDFELLHDASYLAFGIEVSSQQDLSDALSDRAAQFDWFEHIAITLQNVIADHAGSEDVSPLIKPLQTFEYLLAGGELVFNGWSAIAAWGERLDLTWMLNAANTFQTQIQTRMDPLMIDLDGDGFHLTTSVNNDIYFDMDGDSFAEATSWNADSNDGFLVRDVNANGRIDGVQEMFGNATIDGFSDLRAYDLNEDGVIDSSDAIWSTLKIWRDDNLDGQTLSSELHTLSSLNITGINVGVSFINDADITGANWLGIITDTSSVTTSTGSLIIGNANFTVDQRNSEYIGEHTYDLTTFLLPDKRGYSDMMSLRDALNVDTSDDLGVADNVDTLREKFEHLAVQDISTFFTNYADNVALFERAMFQWAGVVNVASNLRGVYMEEARILGFMEAFFGHGFIAEDTNSPNPGAVQAQEMEDLWTGRVERTVGNGVFQNMKAGIFAQMAAGALFEDAYYDYASDAIKVVDNGNFRLNLDTLEILEDAASALSTLQDKQTFWIGVIDYIRSTGVYTDGANGNNDNHLRLASSSDIVALDDAIKNSTGNEYDLNDIKYRHQNPTGETLNGTSGNDDGNQLNSPVAGTIYDDTIYGNAGSDQIVGGGGNDTLYANTSDTSVSDAVLDQLYGGDGHDTLYADASGDALYGGAGNDYLVGSSGDDHLVDSSYDSGGQNLLEGGAGNDNYYVETGIIHIDDSAGTDILNPGYYGPSISNGTIYELGSSVYVLDQLTFSRFGDTGLKIYGASGGYAQGFVVYIADQFSALNDMSGAGIEYIRLNISGGFLNLKEYLLNYTGSIVTDGSEFNDTINGIAVGSVNDYINANGGDDIVHGNLGNDEIYGGSGNDQIFGDEGNDKLYGDAGTDILDGGEGDDELFGGAGDDTYIYSGGDDIFNDNSESAADVIQLTEGITENDLTFTRVSTPGWPGYHMKIDIAGHGSILIYAHLNSPIETLRFADNTTLDLTTVSYSAVHGSEDGETINGQAADDVIYLYGGNDTSNAGNGNDIVYGGDGSDTINGGSGDDTLYGDAGNDSLTGGDGDDTLIGGDGDDTLWASGGGNDIYVYHGGNDIIWEVDGTYDQINMAEGISATDVSFGKYDSDLVITVAGYGSITIKEHFSGYRAVEIINFNSDPSVNLWNQSYVTHGTNNNDGLYGVQNGGLNTDTIYGYDGNDGIYSGAGNDVVYGGNGNDNISGGDGNDTLYGDAGDDYISGDLGDDIIYGGSGNNTLYGDWGYDVGNDILYDGVNDDYMSGGRGNDIYTYSGGNDIIDDLGMSTDIDEVRLTEGITLEDLSFSRIGQSAKIDIEGFGSIMLNNQFSGYIETLRFFDNSTYDLSSQQYTTHGTENNDYLLGIEFGGSIHETAYLYAGNDTAYMKEGADIVYAGAGDDSIMGDGGMDQLHGEDGDDYLDGGNHDDILIGGNGNDYLYGGNGLDTASYVTASSGVSVNLLLTSSQNTIGAGLDQLSNIENLTGSHHNDNLHGDGLSNLLSGLDGDDILDGDAGDDILKGGSGDDIYIYSSGHDILDEEISSSLHDEIHFGSGIDLSDLTFVEQGNDLKINIAGAGSITILNQLSDNGSEIEKIRFSDNSTYTLYSPQELYGTNADDVLNGVSNGSDGDIIYLYDGNDTSNAGVDDDIVYGGNGNDIINGDAGNDTLYGDAGNDNINGGDGDDLISGGDGDDVIVGGTGHDTINYSEAASGVTINLNLTTAQNTGGAGVDTLSEIESAVGSDFDDVITVKFNNTLNKVEGGLGNDTLIGSLSTLSYEHATSGITINLSLATAQNTGGAGIDTVSGFVRLIASACDDVIYGSATNNIIDGGLGNDYINAQGGTGDVIDYRLALSAVTVDLSLTTAQDTGGYGVDTLLNFERVYGSEFNDVLTGTAGINYLWGEDGNDVIHGGDGDDYIYGGLGNDSLYGGSGKDTLSYMDATAGVVVNLSLTTAQDTGGAGVDIFSGFEVLEGSPYDDILYGTSGNDTITGNGGDDLYYADLGDDIINGYSSQTHTLSFENISSAITVDLNITSAQNTGGAGYDKITGIRGIIGTSGNDIIIGGPVGNNNANIFEGGDGDDYIDGGAGNDTVSYAHASAGVVVNLSLTTAQDTLGAGIDTLVSMEYFLGSAYDDVVYATGTNRIEMGSGDDLIYASSASVSMYGDDGNDTVSFQNLALGVSYTAIADRSIENIIGTNYNDTFKGYNADNNIYAGDGDDVVHGSLGVDYLDGGDGIDTISYLDSTSGVTVNLLQGQATIGSSINTLVSFERVVGSKYNDTLVGDGQSSYSQYGGANIALNLSLTSAQDLGVVGTDTISGFVGIISGSGGDTLRGNAQNNILSAGGGNDTVYGDLGDDVLDGGIGTDTLSYLGHSSGVAVDLSIATSQNTIGAGYDTISGFENLTGTAYDDILKGNSSANEIKGGNGNDIIYAGSGLDKLYGESGNDTIDFSEVSAAVTVNLNTTTQQNTGGAGSITLQTFENIVGSGYDDNLTGTGASNVMRGGAGNDTISGGNGNDILYGGAGNDSLTGGNNIDTFVFDISAIGSIDTITDFNKTQDKLDISEILYGYDPLSSAIDDFISFTTSGSNTLVSVDRDGSGTTYSSQSIATINGVTDLDADVMLVSGNLIA